MTVEQINALADKIQEAVEAFSKFAIDTPETLTDEMCEAYGYLSYICEQANSTIEDLLS